MAATADFEPGHQLVGPVAGTASVPSTARRLLVVSHPAVVTANQSVYAALLDLGWDVQVVVPARWRHDYSAGPFNPQPLPALAGRLSLVPVLGAGLPQRHLYVAWVSRMVRRLGPDIAFLEQEPFSCSAFQWGSALARAGVVFGLQSDENLERRLPWPAWVMQHVILPRASFVAARSPTAATLIRRQASLDVRVIPHAVPEWPAAERRGGSAFTVGFAGRLVPEKGIDTLISAIGHVDTPLRVRIYGDGPLRERILEARLPGQDVEVITGLPHERMAEAFAEMDVLVLPSRTTPTWAEQFGRVLVESLWCGVPVIGSDSGEIPWVIETTAGGLVFPEGDARMLADQLRLLRDNARLRSELASTGRRAVEARFSVSAVAQAFDAQLREVLDLAGVGARTRVAGRS